MISILVMAGSTEMLKKKEDLIEGVKEGLEDFIEGRSKHFKDDKELEAYLLSL
jgi:hypothetical protein